MSPAGQLVPKAHLRTLADLSPIVRMASLVGCFTLAPAQRQLDSASLRLLELIINSQII